MREWKSLYSFGLSVFFCGLIASCGGSGSSSSGGTTDPNASIEALTIPKEVSLVTAQEGNGASASVSMLRTLLQAVVPTSGDYTTDETHYFVDDRSMQAMDTVNEILCYIGQSGYDKPEVLNAGPYNALVDETSCQKNKDRSESNNNKSSGANQTAYSLWAANVTRETNDSPQVAEFWVPYSDEGIDEPMEIKAKLVIDEAASENNPFGSFTANFNAGDVMKATLKIGLDPDSGLVDIQLVMHQGDANNNIVHAKMSSDGLTGQANVSTTHLDYGMSPGLDPVPVTENYDVAFDSGHYFYSRNGEDDVCQSRNDFENHVLSYNLYDEDGKRVELNSGFGIKTADGFYGFAGYYGIWLPEEAATDGLDGLEVTGEQDEANYTISELAGRLVQFTKHEMTLGDLEGESFSYWDNNLFSNVNVELSAVSETVMQLVKTSEQVCNESGCQDIPLETPEPITLEPFQYVNIFKPGLGNFSAAADGDGLLHQTMEVPYFTMDQLTKDDLAGVDLSLTCYTNCPKSGLSADDLSSNDPFEPFDWNEPVARHYTFDANEFVLKDEDGNPVEIAAGASVDGSSFYSWGVQSGPMVTDDIASGIENYWEVWGQDVTYQWETGPNAWNHSTNLVDAAGNVVVFDAPLNFFYEEETYGSFQFNYGGPGQLWGIPWEQVSSEDGDFSRWVPQFSLPDGTELTADGKSYFTKATFVQQMMVQEEVSSCSDLTLGEVGEPTVEFTDPTIGDNPCPIGGSNSCRTLEQLISSVSEQ